MEPVSDRIPVSDRQFIKVIIKVDEKRKKISSYKLYLDLCTKNYRISELGLKVVKIVNFEK